MIRIAIAAMALMLSHGAHGQALPPVQAGLWHVTSHASFDPDPQPGGTGWPFLGGKPRDRSEDICLSDARAREPMPVPGGNGIPVRLVAPDTIVANADDGKTTWRYRRVDATAFEGDWRLDSGGMAMSLSYQARFVASSCGELRPSRSSKFGEP